MSERIVSTDPRWGPGWPPKATATPDSGQPQLSGSYATVRVVVTV